MHLAFLHHHASYYGLFAGRKSLSSLENELLQCDLKIVYHRENEMIACMKEEAYYVLLLQS